MRTRSIWPDRRQPIAPIADDSLDRPTILRRRTVPPDVDRGIDAILGPRTREPACAAVYRFVGDLAARAGGHTRSCIRPAGHPGAHDDGTGVEGSATERRSPAEMRDHHLATIRASLIGLGLHPDQADRLCDEAERMVEEGGR